MALTLLDVQIAKMIYPILIDLAVHKHALTYTELVERAKIEYPDDARINNLIPVRCGRILGVIYFFLDERALPRLTTLIISKNSGDCGSGIIHLDTEEEREKCYAFDWSVVDKNFDVYITHQEKTMTPKKKIKREDAIKLMSAYYKENIEKISPSIKSLREVIILHIMNGVDVAEAFDIESKVDS